MTYQIESRSDFSSGASLVVRIAEQELDKKALYTIQNEKPTFVLPFRHVSIDGHIELVYQIGRQTKLQYLQGSRSAKEYAELWAGVLNPLLACEDWFMNPFSFALHTDYLFYDRESRTVSYVYIPSKRPCSDYDALKEMAVGLSKQITVSDAGLENLVLRALLQDFNPREFLHMLRPYESAAGPGVPPPAAPSPAAPRPGAEPDVRQTSAGGPSVAGPGPQKPAEKAVIQPETEQKPAGKQLMPDDIVIQIPAEGKKQKPPKKGAGGVFSGKKEPEKAKGKGLFGKRKKEEIVLGAAQAPQAPPEHKPAHDPAPVLVAQPDAADEATQLDFEGEHVTRLRLVGNAALPQTIDVDIAVGGLFTIGRYDVTVGRVQSSFEFDPKTRGVSRRHAAIERQPDGYSLVDLASSAGTVVNGQRLPPNTPCKLARGARVSFGNSGADYIWEE